ncbi:MAG: 4'-phosphopantetheinyl transferase superfamily protein [Clostridia bacterium]|nr:4'-phosphopantetheinyl transferase superfamily protein [Clostridia bacterium]
MTASSPSSVTLCIFEANTSYSTDDRLQEAIRAYIHANLSDGAGAYPETALRIHRTPLGKPYLPDCPSISISASHSGKYLICAVSDTAIGIDIQEQRLLNGETPEQASIRLQRIARRFMHPAEAEYIAPLPCQRFFKVWTAKESYVKYTGQGIDDQFSCFSVLPDGGIALQDTISNDLSPQWFALGVWFHQFQLDPQHTVCICTEDLAEIQICR